MDRKDEDSLLGKIVAILPYSDGGLRRRMSSGLIVLLGAFCWLVMSDGPIASDLYRVVVTLFSEPGVLSGTAKAVVLLLLVYAGGGLVGVLSDTLMSRIAGNVAWAFFVSRDKKQHWIRRCGSVCFVVPVRAGCYLLRGLIGQSMFLWERPDCDLTPIARDRFASFPLVVRKGIVQPFDRQMAISSRYLSDFGLTDESRDFARRLENIHKDVSVILTAIFIAFSFFVSATSIPDDQIRTLLLGVIVGGNVFIDTLFIVVLVLFSIMVALHILVWTAFSYFLLLKRILLATMEYNTLALEATEVDDLTRSNGGTDGD